MPHMLPQLLGPHAVGTISRHLIDHEREETHAGSPAGPRELMVQFWYPSSSKDKHATFPYDPEHRELWRKDLEQLCEKEGIDPIYLSFFDEGLLAHTQPNAPLAVKEGGYPVVLFSHGTGMSRTAYTAFCAGLTSHGYVVVGIGHTYIAAATVFPDGRISRFKPPAIEGLEIEAALAVLDRQQEVLTNDALFVLNELRTLNESDELLKGAFSLDAVGSAGHSSGGSTAVQVCRLSDKVRACINMDGPLYGANLTEGFAKPCMIINGSETFKEFMSEQVMQTIPEHDHPAYKVAMNERFTVWPERLCEVIAQMGSCAYQLSIQGADHMAFSDWALLRDIVPIYRDHPKLFNIPAHAIAGERMIAIIRACMVDFFDAHLKGGSEGFARTKAFSAVSFKKYSS